jgi:hypothetical protein
VPRNLAADAGADASKLVTTPPTNVQRPGPPAPRPCDPVDPNCNH